MRYLVINCEYNRLHYPQLIGQTFDSPPELAVVEDQEENLRKEKQELAAILRSEREFWEN